MGQKQKNEKKIPEKHAFVKKNVLHFVIQPNIYEKINYK